MSMRRALNILVVGSMGVASATWAAEDAATLVEQGHWRRARAAVEAALAAKPDDAVARAQHAEVLQAYGENDAALKEAEKAVELAPQSAAAHYRLSEVLGDMAGDAGALKAIGLAKRFRKEAEATIKLDPANVDARLGLIVFHLKAPGIAGGDRKTAVRMVEEIEKLAPSRGWQARSRYASETKDTTALPGIYRDAVAKQPGQYEARMTLANWSVPLWRNARPAAEENALAAMALEPARVGPYLTLAIVLAGARRWDELDALLARADAAVPDDLSPHYQAGRVALVEAGDAARSERYFRRYLSQPPEIRASTHAAARWRLAQALERQGRRDEAVAELRAAVKLDPKFEPAKKDLKRMTS